MPGRIIKGSQQPYVDRMTQLRPHFLTELFRYRQRQRRSPLEDFLTAALVGFVETLPSEKQFEIAASLFIAPSERRYFMAICRGASKYRWDTQLTLPNGKRPDIVFWLDDLPVIVIENKIWSGIAVHASRIYSNAEVEDIDSNATFGQEITQEEVNQLTTYGRWLRDARMSSPWRGSLVLLTHGTPPPADFDLQNVGTYAAIPHTCRWSMVYWWIIKYLKNESAAGVKDTASIFLGLNLTNFLEKQGFKVMPLNFSDIDVLAMQFASRNRIRDAFSETLASIRTSCSDLVAPNDAKVIKYEQADSILWGWVYLQGEKMPPTTYFGWGLRFPANQSWWEEIRNQLPDENHVFNILSSDKKSFNTNQIPDNIRPHGWLVGNEGKDLIGAAALSALPAAPTLQQALTIWSIENLKSLRPALAHISNQAVN